MYCQINNIQHVNVEWWRLTFLNPQFWLIQKQKQVIVDKGAIENIVVHNEQHGNNAGIPFYVPHLKQRKERIGNGDSQ